VAKKTRKHNKNCPTNLHKISALTRPKHHVLLIFKVHNADGEKCYASFTISGIRFISHGLSWIQQRTIPSKLHGIIHLKSLVSFSSTNRVDFYSNQKKFTPEIENSFMGICSLG